MEKSISHNRSEETAESKARWFQSLSVAERIRIFNEMTEFMLSVNPRLKDKPIDRSTPQRILVLELPDHDKQ